MSLKKVNQVKKDRFFKIWDILIYGIVAVVIVALFLAVTLTQDTGALTGINIYYQDALAFTYDFDEDEYEIRLENNIRVEAENSDHITLIFCENGGSFDGPTDFNIIEIDKRERTVQVTESDCSSNQSCVRSLPLGTSYLPIYCLPHNLKIEPIDYVDDGTTLPVG